MNKYPNCDDFLIKEMFCEMIQVAFFDAIENKQYKSSYQQAIIDENKKSALAWFAGEGNSPFPFVEISQAVGVEPKVITQLINKINETIPKLDL